MILLIIEVVYFCFYTAFKLKKSKISIYIWLTILFFMLGTLLYGYQEYQYKSRYSLNNFTNLSSGRLVAEIDFDMGDLESDKVYLKPYSINGRKVKYGKIILSSEKLKRLSVGDIISLELELTAPAPALNPGSFSYANYLKKKGVYLQGWKPKNIRLIKQNKSLKSVAIKVKRSLLNNIDYLFTETNAAFIKAILLGEREFLSYEQQSLLRKTYIKR